MCGVGLADDVQNTVTSVNSLTVLSNKRGGGMAAYSHAVAVRERREGVSDNTQTECEIKHPTSPLV